ncbi:MAG: FAD-binding protein [Gammaproteobacteria bacterium]|nr:FAD-binding protein [Gammaproteobacteria bacterium]
MRTTALTQSQLQPLTTRLGNTSVFTDMATRIAYSYDNSRQQALPGAVLMPTSAEEIQFIVQWCNQQQLPLFVRGRGTGTTGASVPIAGGIVLSTERMDRIIEINPADRYAIVEPGVTNQTLQDAAAAFGFFWPPDPTSAAYCSIGGNLAHNSAGPRAVKYGTARDNVLGLRAVTGAGELMRSGVYTTKGVVGYDLTRLLVGSEGTLAIITEATLKLVPLAEAKVTIQAVFRDIDSATQAIVTLMAQSHSPCALEFLDAASIDMIRHYSSVELPSEAGALLMIELDGDKTQLAALAEQTHGLIQGTGLLSFKTADNATQAKALWATRKALSPALRTLAPKKINEDVVVPISALPKFVHELQQLSRQFAIPIVNFGHAGNGNLHVNLLLDPDDPQQSAQVNGCLQAVFTLVLSLRGTLSGEHGIGLVKRDFVAQELDPVALRLMHAIKRQFDPNAILNPGKMLPGLSAATLPD